MADITATEAARSLSRVLDAVEHHGEFFTVRRHGRAVARIVPLSSGSGREVKDLLARSVPDTQWMSDISDLRRLAQVEQRS